MAISGWGDMIKLATDQVSGGLADGDKPEDFDKKQMAMGAKVEKEHTGSKSIAKEIASDHLKEFPNYYTALDEMEAKLKSQKKVATVRMLLKKKADEESGPSKPVTEEQRGKIEEFIANRRVTDDEDFHKFVESMGVSPHDAEPIVYQMANELAKKE